MTRNQKIIIISVGSALLGAYLSVFIYQRIQRAKADKSILSAEEALKILRDKKEDGDTRIPKFTKEDSIPFVPNPYDSVLDELQKFDVISGMGDY
jgi:hypothetical protein